MTNEEFILKYTKEHYPDENELIVRSMINFYHLRFKDDKSEQEEFQQNELFEGVLDLFTVMSGALKEELDTELSREEIFDTLKRIHIKT